MIVKQLGFEKTDLLLATLFEHKRYDYVREEKSPQLIVYTFYGQGAHFRREKHEIGKILLTPEDIKFDWRLVFQESKEKIEKQIADKGKDPSLASSPALFPYGLTSEEELLPENVAIAQQKQWENIAREVNRMLAEEAKKQKGKKSIAEQGMDAGENDYDTDPEDKGQAKQHRAPVVGSDRPVAPTTLTLPQVSALGKLISKNFTPDELRHLTASLNIDYDDLRGDSKSGKADELADYARRHGKVSNLLTKLYEERSHVDWSQAWSQQTTKLLVQ